MNLNLVLDTSQFKPFDYSLAWNAIDKYNQGYENSLAVYDKIAQTLGDLASAVLDSTEAKKIYDAYQNRFNPAAELFYNNGMNINTARELGLLRLIYGTLIRLLEKANEARAKAAEYLRAKNKNDDYLHETIGTLDDWMKNPNRDIRGYSKNLLTNEVSALSKAAGSSLIEMANNGLLDNYTKLWLQTSGFKPEDVDKAIAEILQGGIDAVTNPVYKNILQSVLNASGIHDWGDESTIRQGELAAARGLYGGIGGSKMGTYEDYDNKMATNFYWQERKAEADQQRALALLKAKNDAENDKDNVEGIIDRSYLDAKDDNGRTKYLNIETNLKSLIGKDGRLKQEYRSKKSVNGKLYSPLFIHEEYVKELNKARQDNAVKYGTSGLPLRSNEEPPLTIALNYIRNKYGVSSVLSKEQYDALKAVGYDGTNYDMKDASDRLNNMVTRNTISYLNGTKVNEDAGRMLREGLTNYKSNSMVHELNDDLSRGNPVNYEDVLELLGDDSKNVLNTGVDIGKERIIQILNDGTKLEIDPAVFGTVFMNEWKSIMQQKKTIEESNLSSKQKSQALYGLQKALALNLGLMTGRNFYLELPQTRLN